MKKYWGLISANLLALAAGIYLATFGFNLPQFHSLDPEKIEGLFWPDQKQLVNFELIDHNGNPYQLHSMSTQWNLVFFGYTYCPDICPITMSLLREVNGLYQQQAPEEHGDLKFAFVSVDGERDQSVQLKQYIEFYDPSFIAASGNKDQVDSLASQLGVPYEIEEHVAGAKNYLVSHTGALFLISKQGKLAAVIHPPHNAVEITKRLLKIRKLWDVS